MIGVIAGGVLILSAGEPYQDLLLNPARLLFVIGGGMIATLVAHPLAMASRFPVLLLRALFARGPDVAGLIIRVVGFAEWVVEKEFSPWRRNVVRTTIHSSPRVCVWPSMERNRI